MALLSRRRFERRLAELLTRMLSSQEHALLYLSVDNSALEKPVIKTALSTLKSSDLMASLGGGEFVILLPDCTEARALQTARLLRIALRRLRFSRVRTVSLGFGIGLVMITGSQTSSATVMDSARVASRAAIAKGYDSIVSG